jgi:hypothetical protein
MNDDVFNDDEDDVGPSDSSDSPQPEKANFSQHEHLKAGNLEIPGYLREALEKYIKQHGFSDRNRKIPFSAAVSSEVSGLTRQIYKPNPNANAVAAMWKVLDEISGGQLVFEYRRVQLEEKIIAYDYLSVFINRIYTEIEEYVETGPYEETTRLAGMLLTYFDILTYHKQYFLEEYYEFCQEHEVEPNEIVSEKCAFEIDHPWLLDNLILFRIHNPESDPLKGSLNEFFNQLVTGVCTFIREVLTNHDRNNVEKE